MRNIIQYPITLDEIVECLNDLAQKDLDSGQIGGMNPVLLQTAAEIVRWAEQKGLTLGELGRINKE